MKMYYFLLYQKIMPDQQEYTMEQLTNVEQHLKDLLSKRSRLQTHLNSIENSIYLMETSYLQSSTYGNIVRGYSLYLTARTPARKPRQLDSERIFSQANNTTTVSLMQEGSHKMLVDDDDYYSQDEFVVERSRKKKKIVGRPRKNNSDDE